MLNGGVAYLLNSDLYVDSTQFINNTAYQGAGVFYLSCTTQCNYTVQNSLFQNNSAGVDGGAIKYDYWMPQVSNSVFINNSA